MVGTKNWWKSGLRRRHSGRTHLCPRGNRSESETSEVKHGEEKKIERRKRLFQKTEKKKETGGVGKKHKH